MSRSSEPLGIYVHIPFCRSICPFCSFATALRQKSFEEAYLKALKREIVGTRPDGKKDPLYVDSIYFGGGTPSILSADELREILETIRWRFHVAADAEVSLELDPGTADRKTLEGYVGAGVNRLSIGGQSLNDDVLRAIGRQHGSREIHQTVRDARSVGLTNINMDFMVGLPGEDLDRDLERLPELRPEHASVYILELGSEVPMAREEASGNLELPDDVNTLDSYRLVREALMALDLKAYEISNLARPGYESRHNLKYWTDQPYLGFGASAHSYYQGVRFWNVRNPARYVEDIEDSGVATETTEPYEPQRRAAEHLFTGLRRVQGVSLQEVQKRYGVSVMDRYGERLQPFVELGLVVVSDGILRLSERGFLVSNEVFEIFL
ncbi:MAG TPA: radical SAM family heme chaperone HemW [Vicinamibacteria bacterium]|jgi:oxygen-independent coproporphyrinogen-3 oxidase